ncbi:hypothetical protein [Nitratireductor sp. XY-223]|uniref:hypothetical protein n=1 Tax=Nitratireductor sp. XY-223 TaxID=2561926 RepID=UPI00145BC34E|nr:hypothetical protein [Nitratireductor sp. XY-223]
MKHSPHYPMKSTEGMVDYDRNSAAQQQIVNTQSARIRELVECLSPAGPEVTVVDYGCGPGSSAVEAVRPSIEVCRARFPDLPVSVVHADQPGNDWNALFELVYGTTGYQGEAGGIRTSAAVGTFYGQMVPANSVDMATCFAASHWLSRAVDVHLPGSIWFADAAGEARAQLWDQARQDWVAFLSRRADELRSGGHLLVATLGSVPEDDEINGTAASGRGIYRAIQVVAQSMADDGLIDAAILDNFVFALWFMTEIEARRPLEDDAVLSEAFDILEISVAPAPGNYRDVFGAFAGDPDEYAKRYRGYIRAFADSTLRKQLLEPSAKDAKDADKLADEFFDRLEELYRTETSKYAFELWHLLVVLKKT